MKLGLINSAWAQAGRDTAYGIRMTREIGFDSIDIFADPLDIDAAERRLIRRECSRVGLPIISVACVAVGLIDFNPSVQRFHLDRCRKYLDLCHELEAKNLLLVLGEYIWQREVIPPAAQWQWAVETCRAIGDYADRKKIDIALELEPFRLSLLNNVDEMVRFVNDCKHARVRANIDVSHLVLSDTGPADLAKLKGKAIHVHLSDCDGKVHGDLPPGRGIVKFEPYLQAIKELKIDGVVSIELEYSPDPKRIVEWVTEAYTQTDKLMRLVDLRG
jgi:D-psicose/D-tagatose/L-ribulose 3-epimerase